MSYHIKYRPSTLDEMEGNATTLAIISSYTSSIRKCPHSFLLHGDTGCGKTTLARIISKNLGCEITSPDYSEIDSADLRGIDIIREIRKQSMYLPLQSPRKVWVIDECHKMTNDAQNAFLKILEDTPKHVYFILCTTEPQKLISTIKGRCSQFQLLPLTSVEMKKLLKKVTRSEKKGMDNEVYEQIIKLSDGKPRNALQILEQILAVPKDMRLEIAQQTSLKTAQSIELCRVLLKNGSGWKEIRTILTGLKDQEPENVRRMVLGYCQSILLKTDNPLCGLIMEEFMEPFYNSGFPQLVYACYSIIKNR